MSLGNIAYQLDEGSFTNQEVIGRNVPAGAPLIWDITAITTANLIAPGGIVIDVVGGVPYYNSGTKAVPVMTSLVGGAGAALDTCFDLGKTIDGANSSGNALQVGDGTDDVLIYTASSEPTISTDGAANLNLTSASGAIAIAGTASSSNIVTITRSNTATGGNGLTVNMGTAAQAGNALDLNFGAGAGTGDAINIDMGATNVAGMGITVASAGTGVTGEGSCLNVAHTGDLVAGADVVRIHSTGNISTTSNLVSIEQDTGAGGAGSYGLYINCTGTNVEGIKVDAGNVVIDEDLTVTGTATIGTLTINAVQAAAGLTLNGVTGGSGTVTIGNLSTGGIIISDNMTISQPVRLSSTTDISFNAATELISSSAAGQLDIDAVTEVEIATATLDVNAGTAINMDTAAFSIDGTATSNVSVTGANLTVQTITSGNLILSTTTAGDIDIQSVATIDIDAADIELNLSAGGLVFDNADTGDSMTITSAAAAASGIKLTTSATNGTGIELICAASTTVAMELIDGTTGNWIGATNVGMLSLTCDGALAHANASLLYIAYSGTGAASGLGTSLRINDSGATNTSYAAYIAAATGLALGIAGSGTVDTIVVTSAAASASALKMTTSATDGTVLELISAASATVSAQTFANSGTGATGWLGATNVGMLHVVCDGNLAHANASCLYIGYSGTGAATGLGTSLRINDSGATSTSYAAYIAAATGLALGIAGSGTVDTIVVTSAAAAASALKMTTSATDGTVLELISAASATVSAQTFASSGTGATGWLGATNVGMLHLVCDGNLAHANASCLYIGYSGTGAATGLGTSLRIIDTGATATSYAVYINAATGEALQVAAGVSWFAEEVAITAGQKLNLDGVAGNSYLYETGGVLTAQSDGNIQLSPLNNGNGGTVTIGDLTVAGASELHIKGDDDSDNDQGLLVFYDHTGADHFVWVDATGDLRIHTSKPTNEGADGVVVGTQT